MANNIKNATLLEVFCEFLELSVHNILYFRKLYPEAIFRRAQKYGVVIYKSIHPELNEYITESLKAVQFHAKTNKLKQFSVCIVSSGKLIEKYNFDVINLQKEVKDCGTFLIRLEQSLRDYCLKLMTSMEYLPNLSETTTFTLQILTNEISSHEFNSNPQYENFPWVQAKEKHEKMRCSDIIPLCTTDSGALSLQMYIEKSSHS